MKKIVLLIAAVSFVMVAMAQDIKWTDKNDVQMKDTVFIAHSINDHDLHDHFILDGYVINSSASNKAVVLKRTTKTAEYTVGHNDAICWGSICLNPFDHERLEWQSENTMYQDINAGKKFDLYPNPGGEQIKFYHNNKLGKTTISYIVFYADTVDINEDPDNDPNWAVDESTMVAQDTVVVVWELNDLPAAINEIAMFANVNVFPNPCSGNLSITNIEEAQQLVLTNVIGQTVYSTKNITSNMKINMSDFNDGFYFLTVVGKNNEVATQRIIKR